MLGGEPFPVVEEVSWELNASDPRTALKLVRQGVLPIAPLADVEFSKEVIFAKVDDAYEFDLQDSQDKLAWGEAGDLTGPYFVFEKRRWTVITSSPEEAYLLVRDGLDLQPSLIDAQASCEVLARYIEGYPEITETTIQDYKAKPTN